MFAGLFHLKSLDLSSNQLTQIVDVFSRLPALEQLNLRANALVSFKPDTFMVTNLFLIFPQQSKKIRKKERKKEREREINRSIEFVGVNFKKREYFFFQ